LVDDSDEVVKEGSPTGSKAALTVTATDGMEKLVPEIAVSATPLLYLREPEVMV
jgi:hypothetical protein